MVTNILRKKSYIKHALSQLQVEINHKKWGWDNVLSDFAPMSTP